MDWFRARNQDWIDAWTSTMFSPIAAVPDEEYCVYGDKQDSTVIRMKYLETALEIGDVGDSAIYLLNPRVITPGGEWEAWSVANWLPGAARYRSSWDMMVAEYEAFLTLRNVPEPDHAPRRMHPPAALW